MALWRAVVAALVLWSLAPPAAASAQGIGSERIAVELYRDTPVRQADGSMAGTLALRFVPSTPDWHGYWSNPGDAGLGMQIAWNRPGAWFDAPLYPVPQTLLTGGLMNHVYKGEPVVAA